MLERQQRQWADAEARRRNAAQAWHPPAVTEALAAELTRPRQTYCYRIGSLAGWNHNVLVFGPRKTGKSQLMISLSAALSLSSAAGQPGAWLWKAGWFLGFTECYLGGNVAYLNAEMDADDWRDEFRRVPAGTYDPARIFPLHKRGEPFPVITSEAAREWFAAWLRQYQIEVLIIDTWGQFCSANGVRNLNDDAEVQAVLSGIDEIKRASYVQSAVVLIHTRTRCPARSTWSGSRARERPATGPTRCGPTWPARRVPGTCRPPGRARIDMAETALSFSTETGQLWLGTTGSRAQTAQGRQRERMTKALADAAADGLLTQELMEAAGGHADTARKVAKQMARDGELVTQKKGNAVRWFLPGLPT